MWGLNWVDAVIVVLLIGSVIAGLRLGLLVQCVLAGSFFGGLFLAGWVFPHLLPIHDRTLFTVVNSNLVLLTAAYAGLRGYDVGSKLHWSLFSHRNWHKLEAILGISVSITAALLFIWLFAAALGRLPFAGLSNSANDALIVQTLDQHLPAMPSVFATFNHVVNPNSPAHIALQSQPAAEVAAAPVQSSQATPASAGASTVRITSFGCGGVVSGSGFIIGPGLVATNAHVIAGVKRPIIKNEGRSYAGVPVVFNSNLDFAILRVSGLTGKPLQLIDRPVPVNTTVVVDGYPGGNYTSVHGVIRTNLQLFGSNIYDVGLIGRDIYEVQAAIEDGNSGSPLVLANGQVAGILFGKSDTASNDGFALTSMSLLSNLKRAQQSTRRVSTGVCLR